MSHCKVAKIVQIQYNLKFNFNISKLNCCLTCLPIGLSLLPRYMPELIVTHVSYLEKQEVGKLMVPRL